MVLLLDTDIEHKVKNHIVGKIARAGGSVNQLLTYQNCVVEDINLPDGGFGSVRKLGDVHVIRTEEFSDNVVIFRNVLKQDFVSRYRTIIDSYSKSFLSSRL